MSDRRGRGRRHAVVRLEAPLWTGERRPIVVVAVSLRPLAGAGDASDEDVARLAADGAVAARLLTEARGHVIERSLTMITAVWGYPIADGSGPVPALRVAQDIRNAIDSSVCSASHDRAIEPRGSRSHVSVAVEYGSATIMAAADGLIWSEALVAARHAATGACGTASACRGAGEPISVDFVRSMTVQAKLDRLPRLTRDALRTLAVLAEPIEPLAMQQVLGVGRPALAAVIGTLASNGWVLETGRGRCGTIAVATPELARLIARTVLASDQRRLHERAMAALSEGPDASSRAGWVATAAVPSLARLAHHAELAGRFDVALSALERAVEVALASGCARDAVPCLTSALALIARPATAISTNRQIDVIRKAATTIGALDGNANPQVRTLCLSGIALVDQVGDRAASREARFELLWGLQTHDLVRGEIGQALATGRAALDLAEQSGRDDLVCVASRLFGLTAFQAGELDTARAALTRAAELAVTRNSGGSLGSDLARISVVPFASDQLAVALAALAWVEAVAGRSQRSGELARQALKRAVALRHPHTEAHVTSLLSTRALLAGDRSLALSLARTALDLGRGHGFAYWSTWASMMAGASDAGLEPAAAALAVATALEQYRATGAGQAVPLGAVLLARAELAAGAPDAAARAIEQALPMVEPGRVTLWRSSVLTTQALIASQGGRVAPQDVPANGGDGRPATSTAVAARALATAAYHEARLIGADLLAGHATNALLSLAATGEDTRLCSISRALLA